MNSTRKVALVTGASSGIGKAVADLFARDGAAVVVSDINHEMGEKTAAEIRQRGGEAFFISADVSNPSDCERMVQSTLERYGRLDYACNNAGIGGEQKPTADCSVEGWQKTIGINLSGVFIA